MFAGEIAAKHGDLQQVGGERGPLEARSRSGRFDLVERSDLGEGGNAAWRDLWLGARRHSDEFAKLTTAMRRGTSPASLRSRRAGFTLQVTSASGRSVVAPCHEPDKVSRPLHRARVFHSN